MAGHETASEGFAPGQTGSSAMPHKMNSRSCERVNGFHVILKGYLAMAAGLATLDAISAPGFHHRLAARTDELIDGLKSAARAAQVPLSINHVCGMFGLFFTDKSPVRYFREVMACDVERFKKFFHAMLDEGVYLAPSAFEAGFVSAGHGAPEIEKTVRAARTALSRIAV